MPLGKISVLVVDDDVRMLRLIGHILELESYRVLTATSGETALNVLDDEIPDLVLLDIMLPDTDGYTVCETIREFCRVPIIMVTCKSDTEQKVQGLSAGADDYVTKPFSAAELVARVKAVLRRTKLWVERPEPVFHCDDLVVDFAQHRVAISGQEVDLTAKEYKLLLYLALNATLVVTCDQILENVWGEEYIGETHLVNVNISRLRAKLRDDARNPKYILTKPGIGYMIKKT